MPRKEIIGDATLLLGDCREIMAAWPPCFRFDAVITDPVWPKHGGMFGNVDAFALFREAAALFEPHCEREVVVMRNDQDPRLLAALDKPFLQAMWMRYAAVGYLGRFMTGNELAYAYGDWPPSVPGRRVLPAMAPVEAKPVKNGHPCPRSPLHARFLVANWSDEVVVDPFMGSGTTGVACAALGRKFLGIEIHEPYFDMACQAIQDAYRQARMFA